MKRDDDTFFEDDYDEEDEEEEEDTFPDEDEVEEVDEDDYEEFEDVFEQPKERFIGFMQDPWPRVVFVLTLIGLGIVLFTPHDTWRAFGYFILGIYFLWVMVGVAFVFSIMTWNRAGTHRLRWAAPTNILVVLACGGLGSVDTASWIIQGSGFLDTPIISLCFVLVLFSLYTLWLVQRSFGPQNR
ncbi:MAG: hypothetical protein JW779_13290 [Candidatus Thorarchaeota archaeon]|nr:hypothetical protein [Candidatus Thorarchaeota archaeon]